MAEKEGELLKNRLKGTGKKMPEIARLLGMTRQNLNYHLRKEKLEDDFKRLINEKGKYVFHVEQITNEDDKLSATALRFLAMLEKEQENVKREQENVKNAHDIIRFLAERAPPEITEAPKNGASTSKTKNLNRVE